MVTKEEELNPSMVKDVVRGVVRGEEEEVGGDVVEEMQTPPI